jgi:hypothetical protein
MGLPRPIVPTIALSTVRARRVVGDRKTVLGEDDLVGLALPERG